MSSPNSTYGTFTDEDLAKAEEAKTFPWDARTKPNEFSPVQLDLFKPPGGILSRLLDWWNTRTYFLCFLNPILRLIAKHKVIDADNKEVWKKQLENPSNSRCPDSMKGLWWLKYNHAPEELVTIFGDATFIGTFNEDGTDGYGHWERPLRHNWTRENAFFGLVFSIWGNKETAKVVGRMNLKDGICTVHGARGEGIQIVYRVNDDEWWKIHYKSNPGEEGEQEVEFMYKWLKVLDKDGEPTKYWDDYVSWVKEPLPHRNIFANWWPSWALFLKKKQIAENMCRPNSKQVVNFRF